MTAAITLTANGVAISLDPDFEWIDEFSWSPIEEAEDRSVTGARIVDIGIRTDGRPITLAPPDDTAGWLNRAALSQLKAWEKIPRLEMTLNLRGEVFQVNFRRSDGIPIEARPRLFMANPEPGDLGDWYLTTLRFVEV